jgi:hypothetical protein
MFFQGLCTGLPMLRFNADKTMNPATEYDVYQQTFPEMENLKTRASFCLKYP